MRNAAAENMAKTWLKLYGDTCYKLGKHDGQAVICTDGFPQPEICFILTHKKLKHLAKESSGLQDKLFWREYKCVGCFIGSLCFGFIFLRYNV